MSQKIVLTGAPGTGKTTTLKLLKQKDFFCLDEISRKIIQEAQEQGIEKLFHEKPILFSEELLKQRMQQYELAQKSISSVCFIDRGIPDITAYLKYIKQPYDILFDEAITKYKYDSVFVFEPWKDIYTTDNERKESFEESVKIHEFIIEEYKKTNIQITIVPKDSPINRVFFILQKLL